MTFTQRIIFHLSSKRKLRQCEEHITANPIDIRGWVTLIELLGSRGELSPHAVALMNAHEIKKDGHAVHAFADSIAHCARGRLEALSRSPIAAVEAALEEIVKWKTTIQCGHTHDVSKGYFLDAEKYMDTQWNSIIKPIIKDFDFTNVVDLACGHGRNTEFLSRISKEIHLIDINKSCIDACRERFGEKRDGVIFHYHITDGNHIGMIPNNSISLVYSWDSMVHFDKLIVKDYVNDIARALRPSGIAFLHHSNYGEIAPDSDWAKNVGTRSDMSATLMREYAKSAGLEVVEQRIQGRAEGWGQDELDCVSILRKAA